MDGVGVGRRPLRDEILGLGQVPRSPRLRKKKRIRARVRGLNYRADCTSLGREYEKFIVSSATAAPGAYSTRACRPRWAESAGGGGRRRMETDGRRKGRRTPKPQSPTPPNSSAAMAPAARRGAVDRRTSPSFSVLAPAASKKWAGKSSPASSDSWSESTGAARARRSQCMVLDVKEAIFSCAEESVFCSIRIEPSSSCPGPGPAPARPARPRPPRARTTAF